jgi:acyl-CoA thioesterase FadM
MSGWIETYRGSVAPWECDMTEHFTVAYYFDRFADATLALLEDLGIGLTYMQGERMGSATVACNTRYLRELRAGDALHIESALLSVDGKRLEAGHRVYDSATGELCTEMRQTLIHMHLDRRQAMAVPVDRVAALTARCGAWDGATWDDKPVPETSEGFVDSLRDTTKPWEIDVLGHVGFQFYVHRYSSAGLQLFAAMGLTPGWMRDNRRGFSTFDYRLRFLRELNAGDLVRMKTGLLHLGGSSIRVLHRLFNIRTGELSAELDQSGVLLDLDARRPTRVPDEIRRRAEGLLVAPTR